MYLQKAFFINRAPFERLDLSFEEGGVHVLSAVNGKGKTTILSHIVDSFYELARQAFSQEFKGHENDYYRFSSSLFSLHTQKPSLVRFVFKDGSETIDYLDVRGFISQDEFAKLAPDCSINYSSIKSDIENRHCIKQWSVSDRKKIEDIFSKQLLTSFPSYRYENPGYLTDTYRPDYQFSTSLHFSDYLINPIEVVTGLSGLTNWLLDLILDSHIYKRQRESSFKTSFNSILNNTLYNKIKSECRIGIGLRNSSDTRVAIVQDADGGVVNIVYPTIFHMSSGETALISLFGEILRQADRIGKNLDVHGIVLIDEIDKHLHIGLQKEVLPRLLRLFPNIQFIVSSHSPFLSMGLFDGLKERSLMIDLDSGGFITEPFNSELYQEVYQLMIHESESLSKKVNELDEQIKEVKKPLIITEGKTDWKHLKAALSFFQEQGLFLDFDAKIFEYEEDFGDPKLDAALKHYSFIHPQNPIIGIFDCDEANGKNIHHLGGIKDYGNKVWGISIPVPEFRAYNKKGISIEFLYKDEDIRRENSEGRRLYVSSEFNRLGRLIIDSRIGVKNFHDVDHYTEKEQERIQCDEVIDIDGKSFALSKDAFANAVLNKEKGFIGMDFMSFRPLFETIQQLLSNN